MVRRMAVFLLISLAIFSCPAAHAKAQQIVKVSTDIEIPKDMVASDVVAIGGNVTVYGKVENSVVVVGGSIILKPGSYVGEQVVVVGGELIRDPQARIGGKATQIYMPHFIPSFTTMLKGSWIAIWATISVMVLLGFLGLAVLMAALIPEHIGTAVNALGRSFILMFFWGILWMVLIVPIAVLLAISIIGIILIPLEILLVVLALILGYITSAVYIGKNIMLAFKKIPPPFTDAILGIVVLFLIGFLPVIGPVAKVLFLVAGFGAVLTTRFGTIR
ncbi:MAG: hypothetical protein NTW09_05955 [Candidatus Omnitrophica bacterium]|nr:hypothetical protein [Candidatus Omnitrophota bacterium]